MKNSLIMAYMNMGMIIVDSYSGGHALMRRLSRKSQNRVKFPDIWSVYRSFQKQTLNIPTNNFIFIFMLHPREPTTSSHKNKIGLFSNPGSVNRQVQEPCELVLTNKQSVYGLFLDQLLQYYKLMPMELDFSFVKSMRKIHNKNNDIANQENLQKAAEILIQAKNKVIRQQITLYKSACEEYLKRAPNALSTAITLKKEKKKHESVKTHKIDPRIKYKKVPPQHKFFQRVKSQGKQQNFTSVSQEKRGSFLLHENHIKFQSSNSILKRVQLSNQKQECRLPKILQSNRIIQDSIRSSLQKNRHIRVFFSPMNRSIANSQRAILLKNILFSSNHSQVSESSLQKSQSVLSKAVKHTRQICLQLQLPKEQSQPKKHRKLMLQLLREKNKQTFLKD